MQNLKAKGIFECPSLHVPLCIKSDDHEYCTEVDRSLCTRATSNAVI